LVALALLGLGEAAPGAFPVPVSIEAHGAALQVTVDGETHVLASALGGGWQRLQLEQPGPLQREYQIDGSDTTSTNDRPLQLINSLRVSPLYQVDAWLRDESSFSRWEHLSIVNLSTGEVVSSDQPLPTDFRVDVELRRPEAPARAWLVESSSGQREGLELDRDRRNARWLIERAGSAEALPRWFFPEQPAPFLAELLQLLGRSAVAGVALVLLALGLSRLLKRSAIAIGQRVVAGVDASKVRFGVDGVLAAWLLVAALVTTRLYHQLPHILDAVSYTFQAALFASGRLSLPEPPTTAAFRGPFEVDWQGHIFSQYPPGAPAVYALGRLVSLEWLVGPLACLALIAATAWTARSLFGGACAIVVVCLGALSPFILFQAGSFLSHPIAGGILACALAAYVAGEQRDSTRWYAVSGALLGAAFLSREAASVLFALPLGVRLIATRRWSGMAAVLLAGVPFLVVYLLYNWQQTGSPALLPRTLFDPSDHFGFGDGVGFHTRHTLAAGLVNTDELLTLLQFDLFGWPPLFTFGLLLLPFLIGRPRAWDYMAAGGFLVFVVAYIGYFYHGIALGPRYYFEAMPWLLLLAARGVQALAQVANSRLAAVVVAALLSLNAVLFYTPAELQRRVDLSGLPNAERMSLTFVQSSLLGPRLNGLSGPALVVTSDWWVYNTALTALNCPQVPDCSVVFALAPTPEAVSQLRARFPDRAVLRAVDNDGRVDLTPLAATTSVS
jgi:hypothetical protein